MTRDARPSRREVLAVAAFIAIVVGMSALPYAVAWRRTPPGRVYTGASGGTSGDFATQLARMRSGARGAWTYQSPYAPELGPTHTIRPLYTALGFLARDAPLWAVFHAARLGLGALTLAAIYVLARSVSRSPLERRAAFVLASIGSGVGWMIGREGPAASWSYDLWVSELNASYALLTNPHFPLDIVMMIACLAAVARSLDSGRPAAAAWGGAAFGFLALEHPYDTIILGGTLAAYGITGAMTARVAPRDLRRSALVFAAAALPAAAWEAHSLLTDPSLAHMGLSQPIGSFWNVATGLGVLPLLAVPGASALARRSTLSGMLVTWCLLVPLLMLLPITFPRRMVMGWHVPLGLAAGVGLARLLAPLPRPAWRGLLLVPPLVFCSLSTIDVFAHALRTASADELGYRTWLPRDFLDAYEWLQSEAAPRSIVLGPDEFSNFLPVYTDLCPYYGHWAEAPDGRARFLRVKRFYDPDTTDEWRSRFIVEAGIEWIISPRAGVAPDFAHLGERSIRGLSAARSFGIIEIFRVRAVEGDSADVAAPAKPAGSR